MYTLRLPNAPMGLVVDAGAHVGLYSLMMSQQAERVVSLEADPVNFRILDLNTFRSGASNVTALNSALWSESGSISFARTGFTEGGAVRPGGDTTVSAITLDELIEQHGPVDCLKIDIEGAEFEVFAAATRLSEIRTIVGELHVSEPAQQERLLTQLGAEGFTVALISEDELSHPRHLRRVVRNWRRIDGHLGLKLAAVLYLLTAGRLGAGRQIEREMPLFVAIRSS